MDCGKGFFLWRDLGIDETLFFADNLVSSAKGRSVEGDEENYFVRF